MYADLSNNNDILKQDLWHVEKMASPRRKEEMIDQIKSRLQQNVRRCCRVLGIRPTYYSRKRGLSPEDDDEALAEVLRVTAAEHVS